VTETVRVELGDRSYEVLIGAGAADSLATRVAASHPRVHLLADGEVARHHGERVRGALERAGARASLRALPAGEEAKSLGLVEDVCRALVRDGAERGDAVVGLGGGATTDVAGFTAAVLLRGVTWYAFPTSLLAQVDAAVGGKTGVNLPEGKNLVGAFHQPRGVACDPAFLVTLPPRELRAGLAEVLKTAWIGDPGLFESIESDPPVSADHRSLPDAIRRCVAVKASIVSRDEREGGLRAVLNFGHTLGHAIETEAAGARLHGEAVALGMIAAVHMSVETGRCEASLLERLVRVLDAVGLPTGDRELDVDAVLARTTVDKKRSGGVPAWQLTAGLGLVSVAADLPERAPRAALEFLRR
jgi:3-dehydroquinate synthase